jgi:hypothetical protein
LDHSERPGFLIGKDVDMKGKLGKSTGPLLTAVALGASPRKTREPARCQHNRKSRRGSLVSVGDDLLALRTGLGFQLYPVEAKET